MIHFDLDLMPEELKEGPHIAIVGKNQTAMALVPKRNGHDGSPFMLVHPADQEKNQLFILKDLKPKEWILGCACGKQGCTLEWRLKIRHTGNHPLPDTYVSPD